MMIQEEDIAIEVDGVSKDFVLSKFPATIGREIICKYPISALPKLGDYAVNHETMLKLMKFVQVRSDNGTLITLSTEALINNHVPSWEMLLKIEAKMIEYNCSFFQNGRISTFLSGLGQKLPQWITKILTDSLRQLSQTEKPPSTN